MAKFKGISRDAAFDSALGARVRQFRTIRGISQVALGELCGVTFQQIQKYERGINSIRSSMLPIIAQALSISVPALLGIQEGGTPLPLLNDDELLMLESYSRMPPAKQEALMMVVRGIRFAPPPVHTHTSRQAVN